MGWIDGGSVFETQIIELYNANLLTKEVLEKIAEPFKETDCDTAGFHDIKAKDSKDVYEIICLTIEPEKYKEISNNDLTYFNNEDKTFSNSEEGYNLWSEIWYNHWEMF